MGLGFARDKHSGRGAIKEHTRLAHFCRVWISDEYCAPALLQPVGQRAAEIGEAARRPLVQAVIWDTAGEFIARKAAARR